jgi:tRNA1Val (adenine37-N6)-methyltransferase
VQAGCRKIGNNPSLLGPEPKIRLYPDESLDDLLRGELKLIQKRRGYRYSVDALLLAHFVLPAAGEVVADLGTGSGVIPLILAQRGSPKKIIGVEIQRQLAGMARRNVRLNRFGSLITVLHRDLRKLPEIFPPAAFDLVLSNPPFRPLGSGNLSTNPEKAVARHELRTTLQELLQVAHYLSKPSGRICLVYPFQRWSHLLAEIKKAGLLVSRTQLAYDRKGGQPKLGLVEARIKATTKSEELPPIFIETEKGKFEL